MSVWQTKLQQFIQSQIDNTVKNSGLSNEDKEDLRKYLQEVSEVKDANDTEPLLKYTNGFITPREHLQDLLRQLENDIYPLLRAPQVTPGGAPFTVLRNVFCYLDYIALLRFGPKGSYGRGMGEIERLLDDFGPADMEARYREYKRYLVQIYRHDLVHLTSPRFKVMRVKRKDKTELELVGFAIISDTYNDKNKIKKVQVLNDFKQGCSLMRSSDFRKNVFFHLRLVNNTPTINSISMLFDLANYIKDYQASLAKEEELNRNFAKHFIGINLTSAPKLLSFAPLDTTGNKQIVSS